MSEPRLIHLRGVGALRDAAASWDDLWLRSDVTLPTVRAEMVARWVERFSSPRDFHALVVEDGGTWVAALPLVPREDSGCIRTGRITTNEWAVCGDLLLAAEAQSDAAMDVLTRGMSRTPWRLLWLNCIPADAPRWKALRRALDRANIASDQHSETPVGMIPVDEDWEKINRGVSKKHRAKMARCGRRLAERGQVRLEVISQPNGLELDRWLRTAFEIEDRSWKGDAGTSVLRQPGMFEYFLGEARQLAAWGHLELAFLFCGDIPIAFSYGYAAKGISHWHKIGYDPEYASCTPGQLLQCRLLEHYCAQEDRRAVDTMGALTDALAKWNPTPYSLGRLMIAPRGLMGRPLLHVCKCGASGMRWLRRAVQRGVGRANKLRAVSVFPRPVRGRTVGNESSGRSSKLRRGQIVEVRSQEEILSTLDSQGRLNGLPFQPEMLTLCGRTFRVWRRAEKVFLDQHYYVAKLDESVLLEGVRCDGLAHGGCQMGCMLLWKKAWLKPVDGPVPVNTLVPVDFSLRPQAPVPPQPHLPVLDGDRYCCQASELCAATRPLAWWDARQYWHDLASGERSLREKAFMARELVAKKLRRICGLSQREIRGSCQKTPAVSLGLQAGELVRVKALDEIVATLDADGKNRGLGFGTALAEYCGRCYRVASRVDRLILEWSGEMRELRDTVALENVLCDGLDMRGCPRACYHLWREIWLERVTEPACLSDHDAPDDVRESPPVLTCGVR